MFKCVLAIGVVAFSAEPEASDHEVNLIKPNDGFQTCGLLGELNLDKKSTREIFFNDFFKVSLDAFKNDIKS